MIALPAAPARPLAERRPAESNALLAGRRRLTDDIDLLRVVPDAAPFAFEAGQYVTLGLVVPGGGILQRPYSPANVPGSDPELELLVRRVPGGALTTRLWRIPVGARVFLGRAKGRFRLQPDDARAHLFVATGTGVAPLVSMIGVLLRRAVPPPIVLVHGVRYPDELAFADRAKDWIARGHALRYLPTVSRPLAGQSPAGEAREGRLVDLLPGMWGDLGLEAAATTAYLCGNPDVVARVQDHLSAAGVPPDAIHREDYWPGALS